MLSLIIHGLITSWLITRPASLPDLHPEKTASRTITASATEIRQIVQQVRERQADEVRDKVRELLDMQAAIADAREQRIGAYREFAKNQAGSALELAIAGARAAATAQEMALAAQWQAEPTIRSAQVAWEQATLASSDEARKSAQSEYKRLGAEARTAREIAQQAQGEAYAAVSEALRQLAFARGEQVEPARILQEAVRREQSSANNLQDEAAALAGSLSDLSYKLGELERNAGQARGAWNSAVERTKTLASQLDRLQNELNKINSTAGETPAKAQAGKVRQKLAEKRSELDAQQEKTAQANRLAEEKTSQVDAARRGIDARIIQAADAQAKAAVAQSKSLEQQKVVISGLERLLAEKAEDPDKNAAAAQTASPAEAQATAPGAVSAATTGSLAGKTFAELYEAAVNAELAATADYRDIRAASGAVLKKTTLDESRKLTDIVQPTRAKIDRELLSKDITTAQDASAHSKSVRAALGELESMLSLSRKMLENSQAGGSTTGGLRVSLGGDQTDSARLAALENAALNDESAKAKDLSTLMQDGRPKPGGNNSGTQQSHGGGTTTAGPVSAPNNIWPLAKGGANAAPGRKVLSGGGSANWMFVDNWYVIGPFPNPQRRNLNTAFPPESVIDLDATYPGINDEPLRWRFVQSPEAMVVPSRKGDSSLAIYYAYTELWFDHEMDAWIALASDDFGKVWVNGLPVWKSGTVAKPWVVDEAFRKVHFQKGINRILFRVENCYLVTAFSFVVCTRNNEAGSP